MGKTTIIDLLLKIYEPDDGEIFVDEKIISDISKEELRNSISFLPQDLLILNTNIFENIDLYGKNISHQKLIREIDSMKLGLNKLEVESAENIGYGGINLSGGQKQKINILRTILKDSNFIIFDEPTNNLDQESINIFVNQLEKIRGEKTILIITHEKKLEDISDNVFELRESKLFKK